MCYFSKNVENLPLFLRVQPISSPQIPKRSSLTVQAQVLIPSPYKHGELLTDVLIGEALGK